MKSFNLKTPLEEIFKINENKKKALKKLKIFSVSDLLFYFPVKYQDEAELSQIENLRGGEKALIYGKIISIKARKSFKNKSLNMTEAVLEDSGGKKINLIWFSQPYISKMLNSGFYGKFSGNVLKNSKGKLSMTNPEFVKEEGLVEKTEKLFIKKEDENHFLIPTYRETKNLSSKWIYHSILKIFSHPDFNKIEDYIPEKIRKKYFLPELKSALIFLHTPKKIKDAEVAKKRFSFEEIFLVQISKAIQKSFYKKSGSFLIKDSKKDLEKFLKTLPFSLTLDQKKVLNELQKDISSDEPMSRLLEGDVGSGKTIVAIALCLLVSKQKPKNQSYGFLQTAYMAPTEILARQIFEEFCNFLGPFGISVGLLTSKTCLKFPSKIKKESTKISKKQLLSWSENGEIQILIGTHALISKNVFFENLGLVIIDEQHRFGKNQRAALRKKPKDKLEKEKLENTKKVLKKGKASNEEILPHLLSMTATPIPRTLALSVYGDLDLSILESEPKGRKKVITDIYHEKDRKKIYEEIGKKIKAGKQAYVICPRIFEADPDKVKSLNVKSAIEEQKRLKEKIFPDLSIEVLHSKMKKDEKIRIMKNFSEGKINILVSTSVVEVGVNVPNATSIIIEGAERFGLSQLHQLRGRVRRSSDQAYCYLFSNGKTEETKRRLKALKEAKNGFELAELDLSFRGAGQMLGSSQWGLSDIAMEALSNLKMVSFAREEAKNIVEKNLLKKEKKLQEKIKEIEDNIYLE